MLRILATGTRQMAQSYLERRVTTDWKERGRELTIVAELCRRLAQSRYFEDAGFAHGETWEAKSGKEQDRIYKHGEYMTRQDVRYLGYMFRRLRLWWY